MTVLSPWSHKYQRLTYSGSRTCVRSKFAATVCLPWEPPGTQAPTGPRGVTGSRPRMRGLGPQNSPSSGIGDGFTSGDSPAPLRSSRGHGQAVPTSPSERWPPALARHLAPGSRPSPRPSHLCSPVRGTKQLSGQRPLPAPLPGRPRSVSCPKRWPRTAADSGNCALSRLSSDE